MDTDTIIHAHTCPNGGGRKLRFGKLVGVDGGLSCKGSLF